jgi:hypothetical protein
VGFEELGIGKLLDASTGADELKAASRSSSSGSASVALSKVLTADGAWMVGGDCTRAGVLFPLPRFSQKVESLTSYCDAASFLLVASCCVFCSCSRFCCSARDRFLFEEATPKETRLEKLSLAGVAGLDGGFEDGAKALDGRIDRGVDLPEMGGVGRILENNEPEFITGFLLAS